MYKFIYNNNVIDVVDKIKYLRYLEKSKRTVVTDSSSANCVQGSDNITVYGMQGAILPASAKYKIVTVKHITRTEYDKLKKLLSNNEIVSGDSYELNQARKSKIEELRKSCSDIIQSGICVKLSDNKYHEFELTIEDQLNLMVLKNKLDSGSKALLYHEKGCTCKLYEKADIEKIIQASNHHIEYNTTYFNLMRHCINNMNDTNKINSIHYGDDLIDPEYNRLLQSL